MCNNFQQVQVPTLLYSHRMLALSLFNETMCFENLDEIKITDQKF